MTIINGIPDALTASILVLILISLTIASVYIWREIAMRYRQRRFERQQQLPVHRNDIAHGETPGTTPNDANKLDSHGQKKSKSRQYRERILTAEARRQQQPHPQQSPSHGSSTRFDEIPLEGITIGKDNVDDRGSQKPRYDRRDDRERGTNGHIPPPPARV